MRRVAHPVPAKGGEAERGDVARDAVPDDRRAAGEQRGDRCAHIVQRRRARGVGGRDAARKGRRRVVDAHARKQELRPALAHDRHLGRHARHTAAADPVVRKLEVERDRGVRRGRGRGRLAARGRGARSHGQVAARGDRAR